MSNTILRDSVIIGVMAMGVAFAAANKQAIYDKLGLMPSGGTAANDVAVRPTPDTIQKLGGQAVSIPKSKADGQFWAEARVNNGHVKFLVDTGASSVALTPEDARKAGIRLNTLNYNVPIATAGGENVAAYVTLNSISVGAVTVRNVRALVVPNGLNTSLLGMTYLGELQKVEATPNALILRL